MLTFNPLLKPGARKKEVEWIPLVFKKPNGSLMYNGCLSDQMSYQNTIDKTEEFMKQKIIVVGAGISGLSAGCYAQMNGFDSSLFEMHNLPGGLCSAWKKKGYTFDISMHMLTGSVSGPFHTMWEELGITDRFTFHFHSLTSQIEGRNKKLRFSTDRETLLQDMLALSPGDEKLIREFISIVFGPGMMNAASLKPAMLQHFFDKIRAIPVILPLIKIFRKYNRITLQQFAEQFTDPFLRKAVRFFMDSPGWPMLQFPMVAMAGMMRNAVTEAGTPLGGSMKVALHIAQVYNNLGGQIHFNSRVHDLLLENNTVKGIRLEDGQEHRADYVIWAGDGHTLIFDILKERYMNDEIRNMYETWIPVKPIVHVMMGVNRDFSDEPHSMILETEQPITIAGKEYPWIAFLHHCFDKSMAPEGKSAVEVWYATEYEYWEELEKDKEKYEAEKNRIAEYTVRQLDQRFPGFASQVEVIDVPTPVTYKRYTGNWKGSPDGWYITPDNMNKMNAIHTLPGLEGLYMSGQWTVPFAGTVISALTGRQAIQLMCHREGKKFNSKPH
jgi:phytoene dehydrogenase-like protein